LCLTTVHVPALAPTLQALVSREVRDTSRAAMHGEPQANEEALEEETFEGLHQPEEGELPDLDPAKALVAAHVKKRKLYRQLTGEEVPWFPHDNAPEFLKELCRVAGKPRWVLHGTPAGGAGLQGCLESGLRVVALCWDPHHREHLRRNVLERAVESMVDGTSNVFKDAALRERALELKLSPQSYDESEDDTEGWNATSSMSSTSPSSLSSSQSEASGEAEPSRKKRKKKSAASAARRSPAAAAL